MTSKHQWGESVAPPTALKLPPNANMQGALNAMQRAAKAARQVALQTGTNLILVRNGQVVAVSPHDVDTPQ